MNNIDELYINFYDQNGLINLFNRIQYSVPLFNYYVSPIWEPMIYENT